MDRGIVNVRLDTLEFQFNQPFEITARVELADMQTVSSLILSIDRPRGHVRQEMTLSDWEDHFYRLFDIF